MGYEFFGEKIIFPSTLVLGINNDQSRIILSFPSETESTNKNKHHCDKGLSE